jgi:hypothetical protein
LLAHLRRWHMIEPEAKDFVEFNGKAEASDFIDAPLK